MHARPAAPLRRKRRLLATSAQCPAGEEPACSLERKETLCLLGDASLPPDRGARRATTRAGESLLTMLACCSLHLQLPAWASSARQREAHHLAWALLIRMGVVATWAFWP
ncbi:hypothetical protein Dimus_006002, partial [Dionaea muscipula]